MTIELDNRLYKDIVQWCEINGVECIKYIEKTLRERLATDKYGDLNEKIEKKFSVKEKEEIMVEKPDTEVINNMKENKTEVVEEKENDNKKETLLVSEEPVVKKKRTLKTK